MSYLDELKKISLNVFFVLGFITIGFYIYNRNYPYSFIGLEERFLATTLLFGFLCIIFRLKEISDYALAFKSKIFNKTYISKQKTIFSFPKILISGINKTQITQIIYFLLIIMVSFGLIFFSSKFLPQLGDLFPYFILIYFFISLIQKYDSRIPIAFALFLLFLTAITLAQGLENAANQIAIYAYYFLVIGVVQQLIESVRNPQET
jgi:hypothetical protein